MLQVAERLAEKGSLRPPRELAKLPSNPPIRSCSVDRAGAAHAGSPKDAEPSWQNINDPRCRGRTEPAQGGRRCNWNAGTMQKTADRVGQSSTPSRRKRTTCWAWCISTRAIRPRPPKVSARPSRTPPQAGAGADEVRGGQWSVVSGRLSVDGRKFQNSKWVPCSRRAGSRRGMSRASFGVHALRAPREIANNRQRP